MTSSMLSGDRRWAPSSARRGGLTVLGKVVVPKPINLPSQRSENHGLDPSVEIVPKGTLSWGSRSSSSWGSSSVSTITDGGGSSSHLSDCPSSGSGTHPSTASSDRAYESTSNVSGPNSRPASASGALTSNQTSLTLLRPRSAETRPGSSQLSRFAEHSEHPGAWNAVGTAEKLGVTAPKNDGSSLTSGDFLTLGSGKENSGKDADSQDQSSHSHLGSSSSGVGTTKERIGTSRAEENCMGFPGKNMKSPEFMDKKITDLSRSHSDEFSSEFDSSLSFYPIRAQVDYVKPGSKKVGTFSDGELISVIEFKIEEHFKNLLHVVEGLSVRMRQLESRTQKIEDSVEELKESSEFNHGITEAKLRELENVLTEVQGGIQDLRDKQEISQVQLQLAKLQMFKGHQESDDQKTQTNSSSSQGVLSSVQQHSNRPNSTSVISSQQFPVLSSVQHHSNQSNPTSVASPQQFPFPPQPNVPQIQSHQSRPPIATAGQFLPQVSQIQMPVSQAGSNYSPPIFSPESTHQQYCMPPIQQPEPTPAAPYQPYHQVPQCPLISQLQPFPLLHPSHNAVDPQTRRLLAKNVGEISYTSPRSHNTGIHETYNAPGFIPPNQQIHFGSNERIFCDQPIRSSEHSTEHMQPSRECSFRDVSQSVFPSQYSSSRMKSSELAPYFSGLGSENRFSQLPPPESLPRALPMASDVDSGSGSSGTGNSIPTDDVIDHIVAMGFRRDIVRATVKKVTENGQSVDLNVVLDKLMNSGEVQNESSRFGR